MQHLSIRVLFIAIGFVTLLVAGTMATVGEVEIAALDSRLKEMNASAAAVRYHLEADMMHDALRADVLAALAVPEFASDEQKQNVRDALADHVTRLRETFTELSHLDLPPDVEEALRGVVGPLEEYVVAAQRQVAAGLTDRRTALSEQPNFDRTFRALEDSLEQVSEQIQALNNSRTEDALQLGARARQLLLYVAIVGVVLALGGIWIGMRYIVRPVINLKAAVASVAGGQTTAAVPHTEWRSEVGALATAIETFKRGVEENNRLRAQQEKQTSEAQAERRRLTLDLASRLEAGVGGGVQDVNSAAEKLQQFAQAMAGTSARATAQAATVETASQTATENVQVVAAATEELSASVREINQQVVQSTSTIGIAVAQATQSSTEVERLAEAAQKIGDVVTMISAIAGQTNLLAPVSYTHLTLPTKA